MSYFSKSIKLIRYSLIFLLVLSSLLVSLNFTESEYTFIIFIAIYFTLILEVFIYYIEDFVVDYRFKKAIKNSKKQEERLS